MGDKAGLRPGGGDKKVGGEAAAATAHAAAQAAAGGAAKVGVGCSGEGPAAANRGRELLDEEGDNGPAAGAGARHGQAAGERPRPRDRGDGLALVPRRGQGQVAAARRTLVVVRSMGRRKRLRVTREKL
jgi:hypothetical protein